MRRIGLAIALLLAFAPAAYADHPEYEPDPGMFGGGFDSCAPETDGDIYISPDYEGWECKFDDTFGDGDDAWWWEPLPEGWPNLPPPPGTNPMMSNRWDAYNGSNITWKWSPVQLVGGSGTGSIWQRIMARTEYTFTLPNQTSCFGTVGVVGPCRLQSGSDTFSLKGQSPNFTEVAFAPGQLRHASQVYVYQNGSWVKKYDTGWWTNSWTTDRMTATYDWGTTNTPAWYKSVAWSQQLLSNGTWKTLASVQPVNAVWDPPPDWKGTIPAMPKGKIKAEKPKKKGSPAAVESSVPTVPVL